MPNVPSYSDLQRQRRLALDNTNSYKSVMLKRGESQAVLYNPIVERTRVFNAAGALIVSVAGNIPVAWVQNQLAARAVSFASDNSITSIGELAFNGSGITSANIPMGVTTIGAQSFSFCTSLTSVTIPSSVTSIGQQVFATCSTLTMVTLPNSITSIGSYAFYNCGSLVNITIPGGVTSIGSYAFRDCSSLTSITIPSGVTSIGQRAFEACFSLATVLCNVAPSAFVGFNTFLDTVSPLTIRVPAIGAVSDSWTVGGPQSFQGNNNVIVIKNL